MLNYLLEPTLGVAFLQGNDDFIDAVIRQRIQDQECSQSPFEKHRVPRRYNVRIRHKFVGGAVEIISIDVSFSSEHVEQVATWNRFMPRQDEMPRPHYYYLGADGIESIAAVIRLYHDDADLRARLLEEGDTDDDEELSEAAMDSLHAEDASANVIESEREGDAELGADAEAEEDDE